MSQEYLLSTAQKLSQPSQLSAEEFSGKNDQLAASVNKALSAREDLESLIGQGNTLMMQDNTRNFARFMESMFSEYQPKILVETVLWVFRAYRSHGFQLAFWPANLDTWVELLRAELSTTAFDEIYPFYHWITVHIATFVTLSDAQLAADHTHE